MSNHHHSKLFSQFVFIMIQKGHFQQSTMNNIVITINVKIIAIESVEHIVHRYCINALMSYDKQLELPCVSS